VYGKPDRGTIGAAMRLMTSLPVPPPRRIDSRLARTTATATVCDPFNSIRTQQRLHKRKPRAQREEQQ
jgi:hypothetical protein